MDNVFIGFDDDYYIIMIPVIKTFKKLNSFGYLYTGITYVLDELSPRNRN